MKISNGVLTVFPTELARRRFERSAVLEQGVLDASRLLTFRQLLDCCERAARRQNLLTGRVPGNAEESLLLEITAERVSFASGQPLARLSVSARAGLLRQLIETFAFLSADRAALQDWLSAHAPDHKLHGFGQMLAAWQNTCGQFGIADRFTVNTALLELITGGELPAELSNGIHLRAVRWFNPFEECFVAALKTRLGSRSVQVFSILPSAHADATGDRLCAAVRSELGSEEEWKAWTEDFADAYEADDSNILEAESRDRVSFFLSAHPYGEIEDAARRMAGDIERGIAPEQIALILRDLSPYTDIVPDVFRRFGIPYHFRRGAPAAAHPPVKALLALLDFPQNRSRDRLCDLLLHPGIDWPGIEDCEALVQQIRKTEPPRLARLPKELSGFFQGADFSERIGFLIRQHGLDLPEEVGALIEELDRLPPAPVSRMSSLFEELLGNVTLKDELSTESGVWILNPMDAAGLRFHTVFIAGMDDRSFPQIPRADSLLNSPERFALRTFLEERGIFCPRLALSETGEALIQEEILFLTALSAATGKLVLSHTKSDADGKECAPGEFFERMRKISQSGAPVHGESFHTILPPQSVRAEDEARQTKAWLRAQPPMPSAVPAAAIKNMIFRWLENHPEFSATALESLARNRFVFFLEKILGIKPDRTREDDIDPIDRGNVIHDILDRVYSAVADRSEWYAKKDSEGWKLSQQGDIPLAVFDPSRTEEFLALAREIAEEEFGKAERQTSRRLGHPAVWNTEKTKILKVIENFVRMDCETAPGENRYPARFEMKFDERHGLPVTLRHDDDEVRLKGKIDRIDLVFDDDGELNRMLVIDYKSRLRTDTVETLTAKTGLNLDCQLALYTFAAQQFFFGSHNTPELNETVQALYHLQERSLKKMTSHFNRKRLTMTPELTQTFLDTLFSNVRKLRSGDLATDPLIAGYEDYSCICRTVAVDPNDFLKGKPQGTRQESVSVS
jgi:RecB family exonuclease